MLQIRDRGFSRSLKRRNDYDDDDGGDDDLYHDGSDGVIAACGGLWF